MPRAFRNFVYFLVVLFSLCAPVVALAQSCQTNLTACNANIKAGSGCSQFGGSHSCSCSVRYPGSGTVYYVDYVIDGTIRSSTACTAAETCSAGSGQIMQSDGTCKCPSGQALSNGVCRTPLTCGAHQHDPGTGNICVDDPPLDCSAQPHTHFDSASWSCVADPPPTCSAHQHLDSTGYTCVPDPPPTCAAHQHLDSSGYNCVADPQPTCTNIQHFDAASWSCVANVNCSSGTHDNGYGVCISDTDCNVNPTATGCSPPPYCKQHPDDPFCSSPPPYCKAHPDDPTCSAPQPFCKVNPTDPACTAPPPYCSSHPTDPACLPLTPFCASHPDDPACKSPDPYCKLHPDDPACKSPNPYCVDHPDDAWCKSQTNPAKPYCVDHPTDPWCQSQTNPPSPYCVSHPGDPFCQALINPPKPPTGDAPDPYCKVHPDDASCQAPAPYCKLHSDDPVCKAQQPGDGTGDLCKDHPDAAACQGHTASGGGDCAAAPQCSGDAIACSALFQAWSARCAFISTDTHGTDGTTGENPDDTKVIKSDDGGDALSGLSDSVFSFGGGSCPRPPDFVVGMFGVTSNFISAGGGDWWCSALSVLGGIVYFFGALLALRILIEG